MEKNLEAPGGEVEYQNWEEARGALLDDLPDDLVDFFWDSPLEEIEAAKRLLERLPQELQHRWIERWICDRQVDAAKIISDLNSVVERRNREGYEKIKGYHVSTKDLKVGSYLTPSEGGKVFYSSDIKNLYGKSAGGWIYVVEGCAGDEVIDEDLGWRAIKGKIRIIDKIPINKETQEEYGWRFAKCEYH